MDITSIDLPGLRREARLELDTVIEHRARDGEDPWDFLPDLPSVDEIVVATLRDDALHGRGLAAQHALARLAGRSSLDDAAEHRQNADALEYEVLREIALHHPQLTRAVWSMSGVVAPAEEQPES
ncbi:hypothetical protein ACL9RL_07595 [Plantibacter sp. Mn2098]|uniref:hypothetical protein n=1 Tax=Plantibacter sp. Mn2098 TaxID=3395266 RepID=UPI003BDE318E